MILWSELELRPGRLAGICLAAKGLRGQKHSRRCRHAFTLAEVMIAVLVVGIVGGAFFAALASGFGIVQSSREDLRATQILMQKLEAVRLCAWSQLSSFSFTEAYDPLGANTGTPFTGTVTIAPASSIPNSCSYADNMRTVTVTVSWINYSGKTPITHSRQMQTQVARYGLQNYIWGAMQ